MRFDRMTLLVMLCAGAAMAQEMNCDLSGYHAQEGLTAQIRSGALEVVLARRAQRTIARTVHDPRRAAPGGELAARKSGGNWIMLGQNLTPEFEITQRRPTALAAADRAARRV